MHRVYLEQVIPGVGEDLVLDGPEAVHALRVKRVEIGEAVGLLDGAGIVAEARVMTIDRPARPKDGPSLGLRIIKREEAAPVRPVVEVCTATPKGGRVDEMIDQLSQVGAAAWGPLLSARSVVDPRENKLDRLGRIAREAAKQCGRAWIMRIDRPRPLAGLLDGAGGAVIMADATGTPFQPGLVQNAGGIRMLIGPEGGWTAEELQQAREAGASILRFGPHIMRIETAAVAAAAAIMAAAVG